MKVIALLPTHIIQLFGLCTLYITCAQVLELVFLGLILLPQVILIPLLPIVRLDLCEPHWAVWGLSAPIRVRGLIEWVEVP
jgi:hypothetical protein